MQGLLTTKRGRHRYVFRDDHGYGPPKFWAWCIDDVPVKGRVMCHKWPKRPDGELVLFDLDEPPATVSYIPLLGPKMI
jgi:hypothetical protein